MEGKMRENRRKKLMEMEEIFTPLDGW